MAVITEPNNLGDLLKYEAPNLYSRDSVTVISGQTLVLGAVVGTITASGKVTELAPAASDGSEIAAGVLLGPVDASGGDADGLLAARHAIVASHALVWPSGITAPQKAAAILQLKQAGILVRQGV